MKGHFSLHTGEADAAFEFPAFEVVARADNDVVAFTLSIDGKKARTLTFKATGPQSSESRGLALMLGGPEAEKLQDPHGVYKEHRYEGTLVEAGGKNRDARVGPKATLLLHGIGNDCPNPNDFSRWTLITQVTQGRASQTARGSGSITAPSPREDASAKNALGMAAYRDGNMKLAQQRFREAAEIDPTYALAFTNLAAAQSREGHEGAAVASLRAAYKLAAESTLEKAKTDPDYDAIRDGAEFKAFLENPGGEAAR
jgi:tetratricopeptide (TPR) repeat protein